MKQATKGALAVATAVALLSGGAGTLAYWTGTQDVTGGSIGSGHITLGTPVCDHTLDSTTHGWQYDDGSAFDLNTSKIVPGDTLTEVCSMPLNMVGDHIGATLSLEDPSFTDNTTNTLDDELAPTATFKIDNVSSTTVSTPGAHTVLATVTVDFPIGTTATTGDQDVSAVLEAMTLTATQTHDTTANPS